MRFCISRLDYCNSLLAGITSDQLSRIQRVQNNAARVVLRAKRRDHATPLLKHLHWLPIKQRIDFKIATLAYRHFEQSLPSYLSDTLKTNMPCRSLRSSSVQSLVPPRVNLKTAGERSFSYRTPQVWNSVPEQIRKSPSLASFKSNLKTHLFKQAFSS